MRAAEFIKENASPGTTTAGSIAAVFQPVGSMISRPGTDKTAKYSNSVRSLYKRKKHANR